MSKKEATTQKSIVQLEKDRRNVQIVAAVVLNAVQRWTRESGSNDTGPSGEVPAVSMCQCGAGRHVRRVGKFFFVFLYYEIPSGQELVELTGHLVARGNGGSGHGGPSGARGRYREYSPIRTPVTIFHPPPHLQPARVSSCMCFPLFGTISPFSPGLWRRRACAVIEWSLFVRVVACFLLLFFHFALSPFCTAPSFLLFFVFFYFSGVSFYSIGVSHHLPNSSVCVL